MGSRFRLASIDCPIDQGTVFAKRPPRRASVYWSTIGHRLIGRTLPLLMSVLLLAFG